MKSTILIAGTKLHSIVASNEEEKFQHCISWRQSTCHRLVGENAWIGFGQSYYSRKSIGASVSWRFRSNVLHNISIEHSFVLHRYLEKYADPNDEPVSTPYDQSFEDMDLPVEQWKGNCVHRSEWDRSLSKFLLFLCRISF